MSLLGVDVGSSSVKAAAYTADGRELARAQEAVLSRHDRGGACETDPETTWRAIVNAVRHVASAPQLRRSPPAALAFSASGREAFPASADGSPLGPCLRTADARRPQRDAVSVLGLSAAGWARACGHLPDRADPANRLLWWRETSPSILESARWFLGWHELASLKLTGQPVIDPALAAGYLMFDLATQRWSAGLAAALGIDLQLLPQIVPWATSLGPLRAGAADQLGLPRDCKFVTGSWDVCCAAVGSGATQAGTAALSAGTWETVVVPAHGPDIGKATQLGLAVTPHPSLPGLGGWARNPNGTSALQWITSLCGISIGELDNLLPAERARPADVLVIPHLSGSGPPWPHTATTKGTILGLTLATTPLDLAQAAMEAIAIELGFALDALRQAGCPATACRAAGGGARSAWWTQLKADLTGIPIAVPQHPEPGTHGAAMLAGIGTGAYTSLAEATGLVPLARHHEPDPNRAADFDGKISAYRSAVAALGQIRAAPSGVSHWPCE
jgi:xylulokinase